MCNSYALQKKLRKDDGPRLVAPLVAAMTYHLVRPTLKAPVVLENEARMMRWGFQRPWAKSINNTRTDKLDSQVWREAFEKRRCLIPMSGFYEYTGPTGNKQAHFFRSPDGAPDEWLWAAGIWETHQDLGDCYSMLMRDAGGIVVPIHDRMPVLVSLADGQRYLAGDVGELEYPAVPLTVADAENPLKKRPTASIQPELFEF